MKRSAVALFIVGLVLENAGFLLSQAEKEHHLLGMFACGSVDARASLEKLKSGEAILPDDPGFPVLTEVFWSRVREPAPENRAPGLKVVKFEGATMRSAYTLSGGPMKSDYTVKVVLSDGQAVDWPVKLPLDELDTLRDASLFGWAVALHVAGLVLLVAGFWVQFREQKAERAKKTESESASSADP